ncbi:glycosyltransferase [Acinetobacter sp. SwsAc7]|nr:glycosyltransferase [Acinetobacter sp. SwsAc7]
MIKISFIIPVYNVENYISECMESLVCQLNSDVEVIIVDDGSTDNSMTLVKDIIDKLNLDIRSCFKFIYQTNQGQSVARNNALDIAVGKYVAFIDSDDYISSTYVIDLIKIIDGCCPDVIRVGANKFSDENIENSCFLEKIDFNGLYQNNSFITSILFNQNNWYPWLYVCNRNLLKDLYFPKAVYFEDAYLIPELILKAKSIYFDEKIIYYYRYNLSGSSLSRTIENRKKLLDSSKFIYETYFNRLKANAVYSSGFLSFSKMYINFLIEFRGISVAFLEYRSLKNHFKFVNIGEVKKINLKLYYYLGFFILYLNFLLKKIS